MPAALHFPKVAATRLILKRGDHPRIRGGKARRLAMLELDQQARQREGLLHTVMTCACLWAGFWIQFLVGWTENQPALHTLTGGLWYEPGIGLFLPSIALGSLSIARGFLVLSIFGALMAGVAGWFYTRGLMGRWRMRGAVFLFACLTVGWSWATHAAGRSAWECLEIRRGVFMKKYLDAWETSERRWLMENIRRIDRMLDERPADE
jgi:hypothetical protein